jgi:hypothetical protein
VLQYHSENEDTQFMPGGQMPAMPSCPHGRSGGTQPQYEWRVQPGPPVESSGMQLSPASGHS